MAKFSANYSLVPIKSSEAFPKRTSTYRPYLNVTLIHGERTFRCHATADSGADDCVFPSIFASCIGLNLTAGRPYLFSGAGSQDQVAYFFDIEIEIGGGPRYHLPVGFAQTMAISRVGVLGQNGFFDRFDVHFLLRERKFILKT